ncbi:MAG: hypothetical protein CMH49_00395 [Myxococcales bacterium]|nr:hypothetical protein [Myxococcales bacterium]
MKKLHTMYSLLLVVAMTFAVACDDSADEVISETGGEIAGGETTGGETTGGETTGGETTGGETTGGETTGGETTGGETTGGEVTAGEVAAGETIEERVGPGDTDPAACSGEYCPSARLSGLSLPGSAEEATAAGCRLASAKNGTALGGLLALAGGAVDTNSFVQPDDNGEIQLVLINHLAGWAEGMSGNDAGALTSNFFTGAQDGSDFAIDPVSFDESGAPIIFFENTTVTDGLYLTPASNFIVDLPIEGLPLQLVLSQTEVSGFVTTDDVGFNMTEGVLGGYLTKDAIFSLIEGINAACSGDEPPSLCDTVTTVLTGDPDADLQTLLLVLGGFDSSVAADGTTSACAGDSPDCNAVSVCILLEMSSAKITGVAAE